jgi:hypothetical protein
MVVVSTYLTGITRKTGHTLMGFSGIPGKTFDLLGLIFNDFCIGK